MTQGIDNASRLASYVETLNQQTFYPFEDQPLRTTIRPSHAQVEVRIARISTIPGSVIIQFLNKAIEVGAVQTGLKTTTGELYAIFNA